jgi:hypothetical protein
MADYERSQTVEAPAGALFDFLADIGNLPRYFEQMTSAEPAGGEAVRVTDEGGGRSSVAVHVSTARVEDRPDEINQGLERTLGNVKRLVEEQGAAGT